MSRDLSSILRQYADDEYAAHAVTASDPSARFRTLVTTVQHRRTRRRSAVIGAAAAAAAVLVGGIVAADALTNAPAPLPAVPGPTMTSTLTPAPAPTVIPTPTATAVALPPVTVHAGLPEAQPMPPELWATTTAEWTMFAFNSNIRNEPLPTGGIWSGLPTVLYLVDPAGTVYEVPSPASVWDPMIDWLPGSSLIVTMDYGNERTAAKVVDLHTGQTLSVVDRTGPELELVDVSFVKDATQDVRLTESRSSSADPAQEEDYVTVMTATGSTVSRTGPITGSITLSPDGRRMIRTVGSEVHVSDVDGAHDLTMQRPYADKANSCWAPRWLDADRAIVTCFPHGIGDGTSNEVWVVPTDGGAPARVATGRSDDGLASWSADGRVSTLLSVDGDPAGTDELVQIGADGRTTVLRSLPTSTMERISDRLWLTAPSRTSGSTDYLAVDPMTGTTTPLFAVATEFADQYLISGRISLGA